jgi:hypothetical protein
MARRKKQPARAPAFVTRLPYPPPFKKEEWSSQQLSTLMEDPTVIGYYDRCFGDIVASGRAKRYVEILTMIAHIGRLPEFDEPSYGKFLQEARQQHFSTSQLMRALDLISGTSGPGELLPNAAAAWEFLALVGDFMNHYTEHTGTAEQLDAAIERVNSMAIMAFLVAVNAELGIRKDFW